MENEDLVKKAKSFRTRRLLKYDQNYYDLALAYLKNEVSLLQITRTIIPPGLKLSSQNRAYVMVTQCCKEMYQKGLLKYHPQK